MSYYVLQKRKLEYEARDVKQDVQVHKASKSLEPYLRFSSQNEHSNHYPFGSRGDLNPLLFQVLNPKIHYNWGSFKTNPNYYSEFRLIIVE